MYIRHLRSIKHMKTLIKMNFCILKHDIDIYACLSLTSSKNLKIKALVIHNLIVTNLKIIFTLE